MTRTERFTRLLEPLGYDMSPLAWHLSGILDEDQVEDMILTFSKEQQA